MGLVIGKMAPAAMRKAGGGISPLTLMGRGVGLGGGVLINIVHNG